MNLPRPLRVIRKRYRMVTQQPSPKNSAAEKMEHKKASPKTASPKKASPKKSPDLIDYAAFLSQNPLSILVSKRAKFYHSVAVYFDGPIANLYQLQQWIRTFEKVDETHSLIILARHKPIYDWVLANTNLSCIYLKLLDDLQCFYENSPSLKCILYVNQAFKNFQSLIHSRSLHVHINHGESDKTSTISNQAKAYDRVFIVSEAAYEKYATNLIGADMNKFIKIGRPQLDGVEIIDRETILKDPSRPQHIQSVEPIDRETVLKETTTLAFGSNDTEDNCSESRDSGRKIVLYAPTWEATHQSMDYTSIRSFGEELTKNILNDPNYYLIYRPHPKAGVRDKQVATIDARIKKAVNSDPHAHFDGTSDSLSLCELCDIAIFDNSAVTVDYLKYDKPYIITDLFHNQKGARSDKPLIVQGGRLIQQKEASTILYILNEQLLNDPFKQQRREIRSAFLGDYEEGESTETFINEITKVMEERDRLILGSAE